MKKYFVKGYLTVFLSLSLTTFLTVFMGLIGGALQNLGKMRFECAADIGMNASLGEFHRELLEQYDLLFVDISYGGETGQISYTEEHLQDYMEKNLANPNRERAVWNEVSLKEVKISEAVMAADYEGTVMQRQACAYMRESKKDDPFIPLHDLTGTVAALDSRDGMALWRRTMNQIANIAPPLMSDDEGGWAEVPLENPAEKVFGTASAQLQNLCYVGGKAGTGVVITAASYLSHRRRKEESLSDGAENAREDIAGEESDRNLFQAYLFEKCGYYQKKKPGSLLEYQLEYIVFGENSDRKNLAAAVRKIFKWRFSDHIRLYFNHDDKYREAEEIAGGLGAVSLKEELLIPVTHSILYAWAFIDSIYDTNVIIQGGQVPLAKSEISFAETGLDYGQYLWLMLRDIEEETLNCRAMDIMEMDIRQTAYNQDFRMDWCLESYRARITATDRTGAAYEIDRKYGYY